MRLEVRGEISDARFQILDFRLVPNEFNLQKI